MMPDFDALVAKNDGLLAAIKASLTRIEAKRAERAARSSRCRRRSHREQPGFQIRVDHVAF